MLHPGLNDFSVSDKKNGIANITSLRCAPSEGGVLHYFKRITQDAQHIFKPIAGWYYRDNAEVMYDDDVLKKTEYRRSIIFYLV